MWDKLNKFLGKRESNTITINGKKHTYTLGRPIYIWRYPDQGVQYIRISHLKEYGFDVNQIMVSVPEACIVTHRVRTDKVHNYQCLMLPIQPS